MMPENTKRASVTPVSKGQPRTLQISYLDLSRSVVGHLARARRVQQDRPAGFLDHLVDRPEMLLVDRRAVDVGGKLDRVGAVLEHALGLLRRGFGRVHRQRRRIADEVLGVLGDDLGETVIADRAHSGACSGPLSRSIEGMPRQIICV